MKSLSGNIAPMRTKTDPIPSSDHARSVAYVSTAECPAIEELTQVRGPGASHLMTKLTGMYGMCLRSVYGTQHASML